MFRDSARLEVGAVGGRRPVSVQANWSLFDHSARNADV
jgi:hypothetical protein